MKEKDHQLDCGWRSANGQSVPFHEIIRVFIEGKFDAVHVGTDSHDSKRKYTFANVICFTKKNKSRYFYKRSYFDSRRFRDISSRIMEEITQSISLATFFLETLGNSTRVIIHSDTNTKPNFVTSKITPFARSWTQSMGWEFRSKPDAWASSSVADRHSK